MPAWLLSALGLLGRAAPALGAGAAGFALGDLGDQVPRRRRRRRALTMSDRNDIAFIAATLGAPAGKQFALIIASRAS